MKLENVITLINAGFTKDEITAMLAVEHPDPEKEAQETIETGNALGNEPKKEPKAEPKTEPKPEQQKEPEKDPIQMLREELKSLKDEIHKANIKASAQPPQKSVDDILAEAMKGGRYYGG